jgi:hypothetical protein
MAELRSVLAEWRRRFFPENAPAPDEKPLSDSNRQALEALGYVESAPEEN